MAKYLDGTGLSTAFGLIKTWVTTNFLSDVSYNSTSKKIQKTKNGTTSDVVTLATVATSGSYNDLSNKPTIPSGVSPYDSDPEMDGTASPGSSTLFSRGDHVHPTDTSRAANADFVGSGVFGQAGTHGLVPAPPQKQAGTKPYILLDDGYWHGGWMDLYFDTTADEYKLRIRYMEADGTTQTTLWETTIPAVTTTDRGMMRATDKVKLDGIAAGAEVNVQSDWNQSNSSADDYIKNKPTIPTIPNGFANVKVGNTTVEADSTADTLELVASSNVTLTPDATNDKVTIAATNTKNTAGATDSSSKLFLIGATSQGANPQTYSQDTAYVGADGHLYSNSKKVVNLSDSQALTNKTYNGYTLGAACEKAIGSVTDGNTDLVTGDAVYDAIQDALSDVAGALVYKGTAATASAISGTSYKKGWYWIASDTFALTSSINVEPGDMIIAKQDKTSTFANDIDVVQTNIETLTTAEVTALWNAA